MPTAMFKHSVNEYRSHCGTWRIVYNPGQLTWMVYRQARFCSSWLTRAGAETAVNTYRRREKSGLK